MLNIFQGSSQHGYSLIDKSMEISFKNFLLVLGGVYSRRNGAILLLSALTIGSFFAGRYSKDIEVGDFIHRWCPPTFVVRRRSLDSAKNRNPHQLPQARKCSRTTGNTELLPPTLPTRRGTHFFRLKEGFSNIPSLLLNDLLSLFFISSTAS